MPSDAKKKRAAAKKEAAKKRGNPKGKKEEETNGACAGGYDTHGSSCEVFLFHFSGPGKTRNLYLHFSGQGICLKISKICFYRGSLPPNLEKILKL